MARSVVKARKLVAEAMGLLEEANRQIGQLEQQEQGDSEDQESSEKEEGEEEA